MHISISRTKIFLTLADFLYKHADAVLLSNSKDASDVDVAVSATLK